MLTNPILWLVNQSTEKGGHLPKNTEPRSGRTPEYVFLAAVLCGGGGAGWLHLEPRFRNI